MSANTRWKKREKARGAQEEAAEKARCPNCGKGTLSGHWAGEETGWVCAQTPVEQAMEDISHQGYADIVNGDITARIDYR